MGDVSADPRSQRIAIVTGASAGMGATLTEAMRRVGYAVVATALSIDASDADDLLAVPGDITEAGTASRVVDQAVDRFGRVDCLVNMAGVHIDKPFIEYSIEDYDAMTTVNLLGFFHLTQCTLRQMLAQGSGHIVNITTSLVDHPRSQSPSSLISLTKGGLDAVTRALAVEYASRGIRVNAVSPGVIKDPRYDDASYEGLAELHPLGRLGTASDVIDAILYLDGAEFVTGEILHVDGGQAAGG
jgi:NAD(P)-dependent dehydrogenase (short-subunit alcohol dehydrogenase family)